MTKNEVIEKAWIDLCGFSPEHDENGYQNDTVVNCDFDKFDWITVGHGIHKIRPKSLSGIGRNNGWIKIESEYDVPKDYKFYWVKTDSDEIVGYNTPHKRIFACVDGSEIEYRFVSHYQPIQTPKPPLY